MVCNRCIIVVQSELEKLGLATESISLGEVTLKKVISSNLFRPPYGRIGLLQFRKLKQLGYQVIFWSVVSYDFDPTLRRKDLIKKMKKLTHPGAVFVFHDNPKAVPVLKNELPKLMDFWQSEGFIFEAIPTK